MAKVDIEIVLKAQKARLQLAKLQAQTEKTRLATEKISAQTRVYNERAKQQAVRTKLLNTRLKNLSSNTEKATGAFTIFKGVLASQIFTSLSGQLVNLARSTFETTQEIETLSTQFEVLTGSAENASRIVQDLQQFSAQTPFQFKDLAKSTQRLLSFGFTAEEAKENLKDLGDVSAASGADIGDLSLIFGQVQAAGKLTGERLLQLQERAIPIGPALAKTLGVAESAVRDLVSKGQVDFKTFEAAFKSLNDTGEFAFEGMIKRSQTLEGRISTLNDNFKLLQQDLGGVLSPAIKLVVSGLTSFIQLIRDNTAIQALAVGLGTAALGFAAVAAKAALATVSFGAVSTAAAAAWVAITGPIGLVVAGVSLVAAAIFTVVKKLDTLKALSNKYLGTSFEITEQTKKQKDEFDKLKESADKNSEALKKLNDESQKKIEKDTELANNTVKTEETKKQALTETSDLQKQINQEQIQAEAALTEAQNLEYAARFEQNQAFNNTRLTQVSEFFNEEERIRIEARLLGIENETLYQLELDRILAEGITRRAESQIRTAKEVADEIIKQDNRELQSKRRKQREQEELQQLTLTKTGQFFGAASRLAATGGKKNFEIQKAFSVAQVLVNGIQQVSEAAKLPFPANIPATAFAVADSAARLAAIQAASAPSFEQGGIVPGTSFTGDRVGANVNSGEMILNRQQQTRLFNMANGQGGGAGGGQPIQITSQVVVDGDVLAEAVSNWAANGGQLGEVQ